MQLLFALIAVIVMTACATNPVTGKRELSFMSEAQEISSMAILDGNERAGALVMAGQDADDEQQECELADQRARGKYRTKSLSRH